jgi:hypothetical protein
MANMTVYRRRCFRKVLVSKRQFEAAADFRRAESMRRLGRLVSAALRQALPLANFPRGA